jgi:predicted phage replisome organizer
MAEIKWIKVLTDIFEDEKIKLIKSMPEGKTLVLLWFQLLMQAGKTNAGGWIFLNEDTPYTSQNLSVLFNESQQMIEVALKLFSSKSYEMLEIDESGRICIANWEKHQAAEKLDKIKEQSRLRKEKERKNKRLPSIIVERDSHANVTLGHATELELELELELDKERDIKTSSLNKKITYSEDDVYYQISTYFFNKIMDHAVINKKDHLVKNADLQKWRDEFRKIVEIDKRNLVELREIIDWATKDSFWQINILSPSKLRKQYVQLGMKKDSVIKSSVRNRPEQTKDAIAAAREREGSGGAKGRNRLDGHNI